MRITYLGHAGFLVETDDASIVIDPFLRRNLGFLRHGDYDHDLVRQLTAIKYDAILLTHLHPDHADLRSLLRMQPTQIIMPKCFKFPTHHHAKTLANHESVIIGDLEIQARPAHHPTSHVGTRRAAIPNSYLISQHNQDGRVFTIYHAGDTDLHEGMQDLPDVDVAMVPLGGWGPRLGPGHLDNIRAAEATNMIYPGIVVPMHFETLHIAGLGSWWRLRSNKQFEEFTARLNEKIMPVRLSPGESISAL